MSDRSTFAIVVALAITNGCLFALIGAVNRVANELRAIKADARLARLPQ